MAREWNPGDVARWQYLSSPQIALRVGGCPITEHGHGAHWHLSEGGWTAGDGASLTPLVVIDPEDREQAARVLFAMHGIRQENATDEDLEEVRDALRGLTEPPKPEEPTGLGAVVEDRAGERWVLIPADGGAGTEWICPHSGKANWADIDAVRVLSEGVAS